MASPAPFGLLCVLPLIPLVVHTAQSRGCPARATERGQQPANWDTCSSLQSLDVLVHQQRQVVRKGLHWTQLWGWRPLTELGFRAVNRDAASWEKIPATKEMEVWPRLSKSSQECWHKAWVHSRASGTNKTLLPNPRLEFKMNLLREGVKKSLGEM